MTLKVTKVVKQVMHDYLYSIRAIDSDTGTPNMTTNLLINFKFGLCCARNLHLADRCITSFKTTTQYNLALLTKAIVISQSSFYHCALNQRLRSIYIYQSIHDFICHTVLRELLAPSLFFSLFALVVYMGKFKTG